MIIDTSGRIVNYYRNSTNSHLHPKYDGVQTYVIDPAFEFK
jgi:hypothetical protein